MSDPAARGGGQRQFLTTAWSLVLAAGDHESPESQAAIAELCERYWYPVYAYTRRRTGDADRAQDLTQGFFSNLLEKRTLRAADPERGRFRSFLLAALKFYLADEWDRATAKKRGGGAVAVEIDAESAESRYQLEADPEQTPDRLFARRWAMEVLDYTHRRLQHEIDKDADPVRSRRLSAFLTAEGEGVPYREVAAELGMSESAIKVAVHRMRKRFGVLLREEVAATVENPATVDEELRFLLANIES